MKKILLVIVVTFCFLLSIKGQFYIEGIIVGEDDYPLSYVNIKLINSETGKAYFGVSDQEGNYSFYELISGNYILNLMYVGYKEYSEKIILTSNIREKVSKMEVDNILLDEVAIVSRLPQITFKYSQYILHVENSIMANGKTADELLSISPGVWATDNGEIFINGVLGATVMVNNRPIYLEGQALKNYLKSLRSENISKIEITPQPTSEFDSQGGSGIINIIIKKQKEDNLSFILGSTFHQQKFQGISPFFSLDYKYKKFNVLLSSSGEFSKWLLLYDENTIDKLNNISLFMNGRDTIKDKNYSFSTDLFYEISHNHKLGLRIHDYHYNKNEIMEDMIHKLNYENESSMLALHPEKQNMRTVSYTLNYTWNIDTLGRTLSLYNDFSSQYKYNINSDYKYLNKDQNNQIISQEQQKSFRKKPYDIYSVKLDYVYPLENIILLKGGVKYSHTRIKDYMEYDSLQQNIWVNYPERSYDFNYKERLASGYLSLAYTIFNTNFYMGLRGESTNYKYYNDQKWNRYFNLFPNFSVGRSFGKSSAHTFDFSYTKRIQRVNYFLLTPNQYYKNKYEKITGNPDLKPDIIHNISLGYLLQSRYKLTLFYGMNQNKLSQYMIMDSDENIYVYSYIDGNKENIFSANIYFPIQLFKWWETINQFSFYNVNFKNTLETVSRNIYDLYSAHYFYMKKEYKGELLYRYTSKIKQGNYVIYPYHLLNVSLQKTFKNTFNVKLEAQRLLYKQKNVTQIKYGQTTKIEKRYSPAFPLINLTLSYMFDRGKGRNKNYINNSNSEELQRTY